MSPSPRTNPFSAGTLVLLTLGSPREKFWGALISISAAGVRIRGIDLNSLDETAHQLRAGESTASSTVFFPMHRVERVEVDSGTADLPSLAERFHRLSGTDAVTFFNPA